MGSIVIYFTSILNHFVVDYIGHDPIEFIHFPSNFILVLKYNTEKYILIILVTL
jgi:hypothetical protein